MKRKFFKTSLLGCVSKQAKSSAMKKNLKFLEGQFCNEKPSFAHWKKNWLNILLNSPFPFVSFNGTFLTLKCETLVLKPIAWDVSLLPHFWEFLYRPDFFALTTWLETHKPRGIMRPRDYAINLFICYSINTYQLYIQWQRSLSS